MVRKKKEELDESSRRAGNLLASNLLGDMYDEQIPICAANLDFDAKTDDQKKIVEKREAIQTIKKTQRIKDELITIPFNMEFFHPCLYEEKYAPQCIGYLTKLKMILLKEAYEGIPLALRDDKNGEPKPNYNQFNSVLDLEVDLVFRDVPPELHELDELPIPSNAAYFRCGKNGGGELFYVNKKQNSCIKLAVSKTVLENFDKVFKKDTQCKFIAESSLVQQSEISFRTLLPNELVQACRITDHVHKMDEKWLPFI